MIGRLALLLVVAVAWVSAGYIEPEAQKVYTADKDYLLKQKRIYQILYRYLQPELKPELYKEGQEYKIEANLDSYTNKDAVKEFLHYYEHGFMPRNTIFSVFYEKVTEETRILFRLFFYAKDFDTFYKTALFCRNNLNQGLFVYTFYMAVIHRPDTKYMRLPPIYEVAPYLFYNAELFESTHHVKYFGKLETKHSAGYDTYIIPYNYSNFYLSDEFDYEQRLNYFTEDIGLCNFYGLYMSQFPFYLSSEELGFSWKFRGELYLYGHKYFFNRYLLERYSNGLGGVEDYDYDRPFVTGYWSSLRYPSSLPFPSRPAYSYFPHSKYPEIHQCEEYETRISQAVDSGIAYTKDGKYVKLYTPEGINILGNMIEGNADSCNTQYYGSMDRLGRSILGFSPRPSSPYKLQPSALQNMPTSLRDPAFYRLYKKVINFYRGYKRNMGPYKPEEIQFPQFKFESVEVDKLVTYFDYFDATISNGLMVDSLEEAESYLIQARQYRLNHKPFSMRFNIYSEKPAKATVRIFIAPKYTADMKEFDFKEYGFYFHEMDYFFYEFTAGQNTFERSCHDFSYFESDPEPSEVFYKRLLKAIESGEEFKYMRRKGGVPDRFILPKGKPEGLPFQLFFFVSPIVGEPIVFSSPIFGEFLVDNRTFDYPLDRPIRELDFHGPNFFFKDVLIYHRQEFYPNVTY